MKQKRRVAPSEVGGTLGGKEELLVLGFSAGLLDFI